MASEEADGLAGWRERTGYHLEGAFAFGDSPQLADELFAFIARGTKRATVGSVAEQESSGEPMPAPGQYWGVLDGSGELRCVMETVEVSRGDLGAVTPAFAWDEGEGDRTLEDWLDGHRRFYARTGVADPDVLPVLFERFRVVWPERDEVVWLADGVRELRWDEREWLASVYGERWGTTVVQRRGESHEVTDLPALVGEHDGQRVGVCTFRPRPGGVTDVIASDVFVGGEEVEAALSAGLQELGRRNGWVEIRPPGDPETPPA